MRLAALLGVVAVAALGGCSPELAPGEQPAASPAADGSTPQPPTGPHLRAEGLALDPVGGDVGGTEVCDGRDGRETLETFDRAAWPQLGVAAGDAVLRCGNADGAGWRHIADGHTGDFGELAALVGAGLGGRRVVRHRSGARAADGRRALPRRHHELRRARRVRRG